MTYGRQVSNPAQNIILVQAYQSFDVPFNVKGQARM